MHRMANATRSDGERNPIGRRTESDRTADATRSGGERNLIGRRTETDRTADGIGAEKITFGSSDFVLRQFPYTCYLWH